ncbi:MAG: DUF2851 family protein [Flavobacteriaceae bacterium]|nr:DUF2851 family protein [Flavobacteriaceae bacterium]
MKEDFLHYIWKFQKLRQATCQTAQGESLYVIDPGVHNHLEGPDFLNAKIRIGEQLWAGNVELHLQASDWYAHGHHLDANYESVILHVVWRYDLDIFSQNNKVIPAFSLQKYIAPQALKSYEQFHSSLYRWIPCEKFFPKVDPFIYQHWLERLYIERLEKRSKQVMSTLGQYQNNWDALLFVMLCRSFGLRHNTESFYSVARALDFSVYRQCSQSAFDLECLLMGLAGLLKPPSKDQYHDSLMERFYYLSTKYRIKPQDVVPAKYFRLRPSNFPTLRLSQFAQLMHQEKRLFSKILEASSIGALRKLISTQASSYWTTHYNFGVRSKKFTKKVSSSFADLQLINTILPIIFCYYKYEGKDATEKVIEMASELKAESNTVIARFSKLRKPPSNAQESQALLQLHQEYCSVTRCMQCTIGHTILKRN